jgi:hypothetical protein
MELKRGAYESYGLGAGFPERFWRRWTVSTIAPSSRDVSIGGLFDVTLGVGFVPPGVSLSWPLLESHLPPTELSDPIRLKNRTHPFHGL